MNTAQIIKTLKNLITSNLNDVPGCYEEFEMWYREREQNLCSGNLNSYLPIRSPVLKLVFKELFGTMPFDKEYVLKNYLYSAYGISYLVYPSKKPRRLLILFSGFINRVTFNRYSWFWDPEEKWEQDTVYLFLNDPTCHWYVGVKGNNLFDKYSNIITTVAENFKITNESIHTCGASMGGYAAILYGLHHKVKSIIAVHPQFSYKNAQRYINSRIWSDKISECGNQFIDLDDAVARSKKRPNLYLEISENPADTYGSTEFINEYLKREAILLIKKTCAENHETQSPSFELLKTTIDFFENS